MRPTELSLFTMWALEMLICLAADANIYTEKKCVHKYEMDISITLEIQSP